MVDISVGTPPQPFSVSVMPTISYVWVPDSSCKCPFICNTPLSLACWTGFCSINSECCDDNWSIFGSAQPQRPQDDVIGPRSAERKIHPLMTGVGDGDCNAKRIRFDSSKSSTYRKNGTSFADTDDNTSDGPVARPGGSGQMGVDTVAVSSSKCEFSYSALSLARRTGD